MGLDVSYIEFIARCPISNHLFSAIQLNCYALTGRCGVYKMGFHGAAQTFLQKCGTEIVYESIESGITPIGSYSSESI